MSYSSGLGALGNNTPAQLNESAGAIEARQAYQRGDRAFTSGDYARALREFTMAYNAAPPGHPGKLPTLVAIGVSMYKLGRFQDAVHRFERYLREGGPPQAGDVNVPEAIAGARRLMGSGYEVAQLTKGQDSAPPSTPSGAPSLSTRAPALTTPMRPPPNPYARRMSIGVWIATGVGVAALVGFAVYRARS